MRHFGTEIRTWLPKRPRAATLVVAASNAAALSRLQADYRCDGVDDHLEIQAAIDAVAALGGGKVLLSEGTFVANLAITNPANYETMIVVKTNVTLEGSGWGTVITVPNGYTLVVEGAIIGTQIPGPTIYNFAAIKNLQVNGNRANVVGSLHAMTCLGSDTLIENCYVHDSSHGIQVYTPCHRAIIKGNLIKNTGSTGVYLDTVEDCTVTGNICIATGYFGVWIDQSHWCTVTGNATYQCTRGIGFSRPSTYNVVSSNSVHDPDQVGIYLEDAAGANIKYNLIIGNNIWGAGLAAGIYLGWTAGTPNSHNSVIGNGIFQSSRHGIYCASPDNIIENNFIMESSQELNNTYDGIYLETGADRNLIQGNLIRQGALANKARYGVNISAASCEDNLVRNNDLYDSGTTDELNDSGTGSVVRDNRGFTGVGDRIIVRKTADETVNNSTTLQNDDELLLAVGANEIWVIRLAIITISVSDTPDVKIAVTVPTGASFNGMLFYHNAAFGDAHDEVTAATAARVVGATTGAYFEAILEGVIVVGATAGNFQLQWAQNVATAEDTTVKANSYLIATRLL